MIGKKIEQNNGETVGTVDPDARIISPVNIFAQSDRDLVKELSIYEDHGEGNQFWRRMM